MLAPPSGGVLFFAPRANRLIPFSLFFSLYSRLQIYLLIFSSNYDLIRIVVQDSCQ